MIKLVEAVILGVVQGLTEFLPISSSGHLVIFRHVLDLKASSISFDISVHIGTLMAVMAYFWEDIRSILITLYRSISFFIKRTHSQQTAVNDHDIRWIFLIITGTIPTAIAGILFYQISDRLFSSVFTVGVMLFITGFLLWLTRGVKKTGKGIDLFTVRDAFIIGLMQGMAILPGLSRSGCTIAVGLFLGIHREIATKFSFLLSIPAILGAGFLIIKKLPNDPSFSVTITLMGTAVSCMVGFLSLKFLVFIIKQGKLYFFAPYCWLLGLIAFYL